MWEDPRASGKLAALTGNGGSGLSRPRWFILEAGAVGSVFSGAGYSALEVQENRIAVGHLN